jgi:hypothetical protein
MRFIKYVNGSEVENKQSHDGNRKPITELWKLTIK